eukprot:282295-Amphidinium_carterae.1
MLEVSSMLLTLSMIVADVVVVVVVVGVVLVVVGLVLSQSLTWFVCVMPDSCRQDRGSSSSCQPASDWSHVLSCCMGSMFKELRLLSM